MDVCGHTRITKRAHKDGVEVAIEHAESVGRNRGAILQIAVGRPIELSKLKGFFRAGCAYYRQRCRYDFFTDTVAGDYCDSFLHGRLPKYQKSRNRSAAMNPRTQGAHPNWL